MVGNRGRKMGGLGDPEGADIYGYPGKPRKYECPGTPVMTGYRY